jgi:cell division ATPase FtsA
MGFFNFNKDFKNKNLIVLDIGSQFIKTLFLKIDNEERKGILLAWTKEHFVDDFEKLYLNCRKAIQKVEKKTGCKAEEIFIGIGGNILRGTSTTFCYKREEPREKIDLTELKYFIQKTQWKAFEKIRKEFGLESGFPETDVRLVSTHIINIKVDNSYLESPLGFQGHSVCLSIFNNYTSLGWLEDLVRLAARLELRLVGINSSAYALVNCLGLDHFLKDDILIIDIGGKFTEVTLIKRGGEAIETRNFNLGGHLFTKTTADFLGLKTEEAELVKIKYSKEEVSFEAKKKIEKLFSQNINSWLGGIKVVLDDFCKKYKVLPSRIFLTGGGSGLSGIKEILKKKSGFKIDMISLGEITKIRNKTKFEEIPSLCLAVLATESPEASEFSAILKRALRLIQG